MSRKKTFNDEVEDTDTEGKTKTYIFTAGKHHGFDADGNPKVFKKGEKIELTEEQAKGLVNKVTDLSEFGASVSDVPAADDNSALLERIAQLEKDNADLREAIDAE